MPEPNVGRRHSVIESLGVYLPPRQVSTEEVVRGCRNTMRFPLERMTGIKSRHVAGDTEFAIDLAKQAIARCLDRSRHRPGDVELLISACIARVDGPGFLVSYEPSTSARLRQHFGFDTALAFDVRSACSGMWVGMHIVDTLIREGVISCGLVVSGEYITHLTTTGQLEIKDLLDARLACLTLGDSGAAVMLEASSNTQAGFAALDLCTFGGYAEYCVAAPTEEPHGGAIMFTDALKLTAAAGRCGAEHALATMQAAGWAPESFDHLIMHQTSRTALTGAMRAINRRIKREICHEGNTIDNLERRGNTATTSHLVALADQIENGRIRSGDRLIFAVSGSGLTLGTALYTLDDLPDRLTGSAPLSAATPGTPARAGAPSPTRRIRIGSVGIAPPCAGTRRDSLALLTLAASDCLSRSGCDRSDIDLLIYAGIYRSRFVTEPAIAALLAGALGINATSFDNGRRTLAFDVFNGGVGPLNACWLAEQMIRANHARSAMVVVAEVENNAEAFPEDLLGIEETGSALLLQGGDSNGDGFGRFLFRTFAEHSEAVVSHLTNREGKAYLRFSRDPATESYFIQAVVSTVRELLDEARLDISQIARVLPPQLSPSFIDKLGAALGLPQSRLVHAMPSDRDLFTSALPYALRHVQQHGLVQPGDIGLVVSVGSGVQVGCALYHF